MKSIVISFFCVFLVTSTLSAMEIRCSDRNSVIAQPGFLDPSAHLRVFPKIVVVNTRTDLVRLGNRQYRNISKAKNRWRFRWGKHTYLIEYEPNQKILKVRFKWGNKGAKGSSTPDVIYKNCNMIQKKAQSNKKKYTESEPVTNEFKSFAEVKIAFENLSYYERTKVQQKLKSEGLYGNVIDGVFGRNTYNGILQYYKKRPLFSTEGSATLLIKKIIQPLENKEFSKTIINSAHKNDCDENPKKCTVPELCEKATQFSGTKKIWRKAHEAKKYIKVALENGLSCNVEEVVPEEDLEITASGTGFFISKNGYAVTNNHVVSGCEKVTAKIAGETKVAKIIDYDKINDLSLLNLNLNNTKSLNLSMKDPYLLQDIIAAGFPYGDTFSSSLKVTKGVVSSLSGLGNDSSKVQIDASIQPGSSGGPLINLSGNVVGVTVSRLKDDLTKEIFDALPQNVNFGIKLSVLKTFLNKNNISYEELPDSPISNAELGSLAESATLLISCWKK